MKNHLKELQKKSKPSPTGLMCGVVKFQFQFMNYLSKKNDLDICYKNTCLKATGRNAKVLTTVLSVVLVVFSISALLKAAN